MFSHKICPNKNILCLNDSLLIQFWVFFSVLNWFFDLTRPSGQNTVVTKRCINTLSLSCQPVTKPRAGLFRQATLGNTVCYSVATSADREGVCV